MTLDSDIKDILELGNRSSSARSEAFEKFERLRDKIKSGKSTRDRIRDFIIVNLHTFSPDVEKPYREMEARLKDGAGSQILIVEQDESIRGCPGIVSPPYIDPIFIGIDTKLSLGVLTSGLELDIKEGKIIFPTEKHAMKYSRYSRGKWKLENGPISLNWYEFVNFGKEVHKRTTPMINNSSVGFEHGLMLHLGEEVEQYFGRNRHLDTSYVEALNLLGHESPERFRKRYDEEVYQNRVGVVNKLEELINKEAKLSSEIESIYGSMKSGGFMRGDALIMVEDEADARIFSQESKIKLRETRGEIKKYLKEGIELGMHKGDLKIEQRHGMEINVPAYISGICEKYQVDLPK